MGELTPTAKQQQAITMARTVAEGRDEGPTVGVLSGYAGVGKSTVVKWICEELGDPLLLAPTGKAALRVQETSGRDARTLHRFLYTPRENEQTGKVEYVSRDVEKLQEEAPRCKLMVVDESSMVGQDLYTEIMRVAEMLRLNVLFVGDGFQLPPVSASEDAKRSSGAGPFSIFNQSTFADHRMVLDEVHRQALESPIVKASMLLRKGHWGKINEILALLPQSNWDAVEKGAAWYKAQEDFVIIAHRNQTRTDLNDQIRRKLGLDRELQEGEPLTVRANNYEVGVFNGEGISFPGFHEAPKVVKSGASLGLTRVNDVECYASPEVILGNSRATVHALKRDAKVLGHAYLHAQLGYASTCHSAQGSEWDKVVVVVESSLRVMPEPERLRWAYTAITRGKTHVEVDRRDRGGKHLTATMFVPQVQRRVILLAAGGVEHPGYQDAKAHVEAKAKAKDSELHTFFDEDLTGEDEVPGTFEALIALGDGVSDEACTVLAPVAHLARQFLQVGRPVYWWMPGGPRLQRTASVDGNRLIK